MNDDTTPTLQLQNLKGRGRQIHVSRILPGLNPDGSLGPELKAAQEEINNINARRARFLKMMARNDICLADPNE